jgi:hypothetical protein
MNKIKLIVIEGSDSSGKSTLVDHLRKRGYEYFKESLAYKDRLLPGYDGYMHYFQTVSNLSQTGNKFICDRLYIGEAVNPIIRKDGRKPLTIKEIHEIEKPIIDSALLITTKPSPFFIETGFKVRGEDVAQTEDIPYLLYLYEHFHDLSSLKNKYIFNVEEDMSYKKIDKYLDSVL